MRFKPLVADQSVGAHTVHFGLDAHRAFIAHLKTSTVAAARHISALVRHNVSPDQLKILSL